MAPHLTRRPSGVKAANAYVGWVVPIGDNDADAIDTAEVVGVELLARRRSVMRPTNFTTTLDSACPCGVG